MLIYMENKYISCLILHAVGDTVGYKNSEWEFKIASTNKTLEKIYEFIELGGVNNINLKGWIISDDTIFNIDVGNALISDYNNNTSAYCKNVTDLFLESYGYMLKEGLNTRQIGLNMKKMIEQIKNGRKWYDYKYSETAGGSGASMRCIPFGLAFYKNKQQLMEYAIESSMITHPNAVGYLGGFASALFTALAVENIPLNKWAQILVDMCEDDVPKYMKNRKLENVSQSKIDSDYEYFIKDRDIFIGKWKVYIEQKIDDNGNFIRRRIDKNLLHRVKYYHENFGYFSRNPKFAKELDPGFIGSGGDDSVIIAFDCLVDCDGIWEKLVVYSMLHGGDTDTTGSIAGAFYGLVYGLDNVPNNFTEHLEYKKEIIQLAKNLYKKYHN